ncbi:hypothetical protein IWZ01DRAFT_563769 [Phyllosticta capitalensis]
MKVTSVLFAGALTIAGASAAAAPNAQAFCQMPGQACSKLKRAADAAANALAYANPDASPEAEAKKRKGLHFCYFPASRLHFCYFPGKPCSKAKRHADAIADAVADAYAAAGVVGTDIALEHFRSKRSAEAEPEADAAAVADPAKKRKGLHFCYFPGEPCSKVKRAAEAVTEALALPEPEAEATKTKGLHFCYFPGEPCSKAKRAADALADAVNAAGLDFGF